VHRAEPPCTCQTDIGTYRRTNLLRRPGAPTKTSDPTVNTTVQLNRAITSMQIQIPRPTRGSRLRLQTYCCRHSQHPLSVGPKSGCGLYFNSTVSDPLPYLSFCPSRTQQMLRRIPVCATRRVFLRTATCGAVKSTLIADHAQRARNGWV
jgi:hypothetical protein